MQIIDTVEVHVLCVPWKGGLPHAKIQVGCINTLNSDAVVTLHSIQNGVQVANIPLPDILPVNRKETRYFFKMRLRNRISQYSMISDVISLCAG